MLYIVSPEIIYLITGSFSLLTIFPHFARPLPPTPYLLHLATTRLSAESLLTWFWVSFYRIAQRWSLILERVVTTHSGCTHQGVDRSLFTLGLLFSRQQWGLVNAKILLPPCRQVQVDCHLYLLDKNLTWNPHTSRVCRHRHMPGNSIFYLTCWILDIFNAMLFITE